MHRLNRALAERQSARRADDHLMWHATGVQEVFIAEKVK
jgi:hypothetical protein